MAGGMAKQMGMPKSDAEVVDQRALGPQAHAIAMLAGRRREPADLIQVMKDQLPGLLAKDGVQAPGQAISFSRQSNRGSLLVTGERHVDGVLRHHIHGDRKRVFAAAKEDTADGADVAVIAAPGGGDVAHGGGAVVCRVEVNPADARTSSR